MAKKTPICGWRMRRNNALLVTLVDAMEKVRRLDPIMLETSNRVMSIIEAIGDLDLPPISQ